MKSWRIVICALVLVLAGGRVASAQHNFQLWGTVVADWMKSDRLSLQLTTQPEVLLKDSADDSNWASLEVTPGLTYVVRNWLDLTGELKTNSTWQTSSPDSFELTPRVGAQFHLFSRALPAVVTRGLAGRERPPKHRLVLRDYVRLEERNLFYDDGKPSSFTWRLRNRLELQYPLNRASVTQKGSRSLLADMEWFFPLDDLSERFANQRRFRAGFSFRHSDAWRSAFLYVRTQSRNTIDQPYTTADNAINVYLARVF